MSRRQIGRHLEQVANRFQDEVAQRPELAWARPDDDEEDDDDDEGSEGSDSEVSMCDLESESESSDTEFELDDDGDARDDLPAGPRLRPAGRTTRARASSCLQPRGPA